MAAPSDLLCDTLASLVHLCLVQLCGGEEVSQSPDGGSDGSTGNCNCNPCCRCRVDDKDCNPPRRRSRCRTCWHHVLQSMAVSTVNRAKNKQWCVEVRTAPAYFSRFRDDQSNEFAVVTIVSSFGLSRTLRSSAELGQLLLLELESAIQLQQQNQLKNHQEDDDMSSLWIRPAPSNGMMYVTTPTKLYELRSQGMFPCPHCPHWFKGLWWHVQKQHLHTHAQARLEQLKHDNPLAMVVYEPPRRSSDKGKPSSTEIVGDTTATEYAQHPPEPINGGLQDAWECVKRGDVESLKLYLAQNPTFDPASTRDDKGAVLLHWAAGGGHLSMVQYLIHTCCCHPESAQTSRRSFGGRTALHWAARNGHLPVVKYLLKDCQANAVAETQDGTTAFGWAAWQGHLDVLRCLHAHQPVLAQSVNKFGCNAVLWAAQGSFDDPGMAVVHFLDSIGCDLYVINGNGHGLLHKAAQRGRHEVAAWFVEKLVSAMSMATCDNELLRRDPDLVARLVGPDAEGCTPSDLAGIEDHTDLALYLAKQEEILILLHVKSKRARADRFPSWLERGTPVAGIGCYHWEAWAGVGRMREAVASCVASDAN